MTSNQITPLILTWNEEDNIGRCLQKLKWAKRIVVIDSYSTDSTLDLLKGFSNVEVYKRKFDSFSEQCNYGLGKITSEWILSLDADYVLSEKLVEEIEGLDLNSSDGFFASFKYCIKGAPLRSTLLPARQVLFRKKHGKYIQDGHAHKLVNSGTVNSLKHFIYHDDRKPFSRWWNAQIKYSHQEANKLVNSAFGELNAQDKLRSFLLVAPIAVFFYCLFWKGLILDGWNGIVYASQRFMAEFLLSVFLLKRYLSSPSKISSE